MDLEEKNEDGADGSSSHPSSSGKKKCLVVHGWRSNAKVSKEHAKHLNLEGKFDKIHLMKGTSRAKEAADEVTEGMFLGPWFSWVDDIHGETAGEDLVKALQHVVKFVGAHGPYASVVGFSQGGALVSLLSRREVLEKLGVEDDVFLWKSAVVVCGASAGLIDIAEKALGIRLSDNDDEKRGKRIDDDDDDVMPSLHVFGLQDDRKPQGERLMKLFHAKMPSSGQIVRHCLYFDGGHGVPKSIMSDLAFHAEYDAWLENALSMQIVDVDEAPKGFKSKTVARMRTGKKNRRETSSGRGGSDRALGNLTNEQNDDAMERGEGETENAITTFSTVTRLSATPRDESVVTKTTPSGHGLHFIRDACSVANCDADVKIRKGRLDILEMLRAAPTSAPLLRDLDTSRAPMTYGKMIDFITTGEGDLRKIGATQSTVIAYNVPTGPIGASAFLSIAAQCTAVPLDPGITEADALEALVSCKVTLVALFRGTDTDEIEKAATKANIPIKWYVVAAGNTAAGCFSPEKDESASTQSPPLVNAAEGVGLLLRTSGTTSKSKVVPLVLGALTSNGSELAASLELISDDVCINAMPLFHIGGLSCSILATVASKASVICCHKFDAQVFYDTIVTDNAVKPTWYSAVPTIHVAVLQYGNAISRGAKPKHSLRFIRSGAAALSQADAEKLQAFWNVPIIPTYSMSEQMPISGKNIHLDLAERPNTVGQPLICSVALVNDGNCRATVPFGTQGELVISGDNVMTGYQDAAEANNKTFFYIGEKRYLRTGDIAKIDSDGFIYLTGRSKELIKRGGEQVSPLKVEAVVAKHPDVHVAVVFGVESPLWGEEVGIAIVLKDGVDDIDASLRSIREMTISSKELSRFEHPAYWKIVKDDDLPKTSTKKYKRAGLAKHLNIAQRNIVSMCSRKKGGSAKPAVISSGLAGLRYCMAVGVMFNHIGGVWQGEDERNPLTYGPYWWSAKATTFYFPATVFFVLGGFTLSAALNGKEVRKGTWLSFYNSRFQTLMPLYLLSLAFGLINMLVVCRPSTFSDKFSWQPHNATMTLASGAAAQCHTSPVEMPYGAWLIMTIFVFAFGFQTWFPLWLLSSWMMYYTWFNGVYYFIIIIFPWMHNALCRVRGDVNAILKWGVVYTILIFATGALLGVYYALPSWQDYYDLGSSKSWKKNLQNIYALSTMMFPPYWAPSVGSGMVAYFWYDAVRPNESHDKKRYGRMADCLTLAFFAFHLAHFFDIDWPYPTSLVGKMWEKHPDEYHRWDTGIKRYVWSVMITRLYSPLLAVWIALLAMPRGSLTGRFLEGNVLTKTLAPTSYGCFLFHQIIGQWYWWATRSGNKVTSDEVDLGNSEAWSWWAYPKEYYWFSPQPLPVAWYEFFFVVGLVTIFSAFIDRALNSHLTLLWVKMMNFFQNIIWPGSVSSAAETGGGSPESIVRNAVKALTGVESDISLDDSFDEIGLVSVGLPILVGLINSEDKSASVTVADVANCATLRDLVSVLEKNRKVAEGAAGVGARNDL
jgi:acyl-CoA synthetase (AMP-forming)/AMP-acid ligase II